MKLRTLVLTLSLLGCRQHVPAVPPAACSNVVTTPGVDATSCAQIEQLFDASQRCYAEHRDPAVMALSFAKVNIVRTAAVGVDASGIPWLWSPAGRAYGYYDPQNDFIAYNFAPTLLHEFQHWFETILHNATGAIIGHGGADDPMLNVNCREYYIGEWKD